MELSIRSYCTTNGGREDPNAKVLYFGPLIVWFSYWTPIAFQVRGRERVVRRNDWSITTGKHLNEVDRRDGTRISGTEFEQRLNAALERFMFQPNLEADTPAYVVADWLEEMGLSKAARAVRESEL